MQIKVKIVNKSDNPLPKYESACAAGMDIRSNEEVTLKPGEHKLVHTGLFIELPCGLDFGYEAQIRPRSGLALKKGITVLNSPGTIDPDYRGEIGVILINLGSEEVTLEKGERIAQMVISEFKIPELIEVEELSSTERGSGGFGHSGRK